MSIFILANTKERQENGGGLEDRGPEHCTEKQKRAAVGRYLAHGKRNAFTGRELGYPKRTAKPAEWIDEYAPGGRRTTRPRAFDPSEKAAAVKAPVSREPSAQEVADLVGCTRPVLCKWKRELLQEEPSMSEGRPGKPARTQRKPPAARAGIDALEAGKAEPEEPEPRRDIMEGAVRILGKGQGADPQDELADKEKTALVDELRPGWRPSKPLPVPNMARSSCRYQQGALRAPDKGEGARRTIPEAFDANDGVYGRRRIHDELKGGGATVAGRRTARIMAEEGLGARSGTRPKRHCGSYAGEVAGHPGDKVERDFTAGLPNFLRPTDVTRFSTPAGRLCPSPVPDCFDGSTVSRTASVSPNAGMASSMLEAAIRLTGPGERARPVIRSDCGCHCRRPGRISICEEAGKRPPDVREGPLSRQLPHGGLLRHREERDVLRKGLGRRRPGRTRAEDRWLYRAVQHEEDQALAGLDGPLGIQAKPSPCSLSEVGTEKRYHPLS